MRELTTLAFVVTAGVAAATFQESWCNTDETCRSFGDTNATCSVTLRKCTCGTGYGPKHIGGELVGLCYPDAVNVSVTLSFDEAPHTPNPCLQVPREQEYFGWETRKELIGWVDNQTAGNVIAASFQCLTRPMASMLVEVPATKDSFWAFTLEAGAAPVARSVDFSLNATLGPKVKVTTMQPQMSWAADCTWNSHLFTPKSYQQYLSSGRFQSAPVPVDSNNDYRISYGEALDSYTRKEPTHLLSGNKKHMLAVDFVRQFDQNLDWTLEPREFYYRIDRQKAPGTPVTRNNKHESLALFAYVGDDAAKLPPASDCDIPANVALCAAGNNKCWDATLDGLDGRFHCTTTRDECKLICRNNLQPYKALPTNEVYCPNRVCGVIECCDVPKNDCEVVVGGVKPNELLCEAPGSQCFDTLEDGVNNRFFCQVTYAFCEALCRPRYQVVPTRYFENIDGVLYRKCFRTQCSVPHCCAFGPEDPGAPSRKAAVAGSPGHSSPPPPPGAADYQSCTPAVCATGYVKSVHVTEVEKRYICTPVTDGMEMGTCLVDGDCTWHSYLPVCDKNTSTCTTRPQKVLLQNPTAVEKDWCHSDVDCHSYGDPSATCWKRDRLIGNVCNCTEPEYAPVLDFAPICVDVSNQNFFYTFAFTVTISNVRYCPPSPALSAATRLLVHETFGDVLSWSDSCQGRLQSEVKFSGTFNLALSMIKTLFEGGGVEMRALLDMLDAELALAQLPGRDATVLAVAEVKQKYAGMGHARPTAMTLGALKACELEGAYATRRDANGHCAALACIEGYTLSGKYPPVCIFEPNFRNATSMETDTGGGDVLNKQQVIILIIGVVAGIAIMTAFVGVHLHGGEKYADPNNTCPTIGAQSNAGNVSISGSITPADHQHNTARVTPMVAASPPVATTNPATTTANTTTSAMTTISALTESSVHENADVEPSEGRPPVSPSPTPS